MRPRAGAQDRSSWLALLLALNGPPGEQHALVGPGLSAPQSPASGLIAGTMMRRPSRGHRPALAARDCGGVGTETPRRVGLKTAAALLAPDRRGGAWRQDRTSGRRLGERSQCLTPSPGTRIAMMPAPARSILTTPGHSSPEHRPAWTPSDPRPGILPRSAPGWPERSDQKREAHESSHSIQAHTPRPFCQVCWLASNLMTRGDSVAGGGVRAREGSIPACAL